MLVEKIKRHRKSQKFVRQVENLRKQMTKIIRTTTEKYKIYNTKFREVTNSSNSQTKMLTNYIEDNHSKLRLAGFGAIHKTFDLKEGEG